MIDIAVVRKPDRGMSAGRELQLKVTFVNKLLHESGGAVTMADVERLAQPTRNTRRGIGYKRSIIIEIMKMR